jgi:hypothetical protein
MLSTIFLFGLVSCDLQTKDDPEGTRVLARLAWSQSLDSAVYDSTKRMEVVVASGIDTVYNQTLDFSLRSTCLPSLPTGKTYAISLVGFGSSGDSLWRGSASFTTAGDTMSLDIPVSATLTACSSLELFQTWVMDDTVLKTAEYEKLVLSSDSSYMSYVWDVELSASTPDTIAYGFEQGTISASVTSRQTTLLNGSIRFNVQKSFLCSDADTGNPCGQANWSNHLTTYSDTSVSGTWTLTADSLLITESGQTFRYHH